MINVGDFVQMVKANEELAPMKVGNEYIVQVIKYGVVTLYSDKEEEYYSMSTEMLEKYFEKIEFEEVEDDFDEEYEHILDIMDEAEYAAFKVFDKCTIVACKLPNGYVMVEASSCVDPSDYDSDIGIEMCMERLEDKVKAMEAYRRCEEAYELSESEDCCECSLSCKGCSGCAEEEHDEEDCVYTDLDCDDCKDTSCPFRDEMEWES
jgi:hypothetical protein